MLACSIRELCGACRSTSSIQCDLRRCVYSSDSGNLYKSTNGGVDWDGLYPKGSNVYDAVDFFQDLGMDPTNHKHVVVTFHNNCKGAYAGGCMAETLDSGATWRLFMGPLPGWSEGAGPLVLGGSTFIFGTTQNGMYYTSDSGAHWEKVGPGTNHQMYHSPTGAYYTGSDYGVGRSADGHTWTRIAGAPNGYGIIGDGKRLFNSLRTSGQNQQPYFTAPESDPYQVDTFCITQHGVRHGVLRIRHRSPRPLLGEHQLGTVAHGHAVEGAGQRRHHRDPSFRARIYGRLFYSDCREIGDEWQVVRRGPCQCTPMC